MNGLLLLGLLILAFCGFDIYLRFIRGQQVWSTPPAAFPQLGPRNHSIFYSIDEEHEAYRIYRRTQDHELQALKTALRPDQWGESVHVKPHVMPPEGTRLVWDVFGYVELCQCPHKLLA